MPVEIEFQTPDLTNLQNLPESDRRIISFDENKKTHIDYYKNFKNKHKDDINKKCVCNICGGSYTYYNKSSHLKTKKCQTVKNLRNL